MNEQDDILTRQETEQLCRFYMDCRLTVLEEKVLQYVLGKLPYSSPCIDEVRMLMGISIQAPVEKPVKKRSGWFNSRIAVSIAASVAILCATGIALFNNEHGTSGKHPSNNNDPVYIAAYCHGLRLNGSEAITATNMAMAKADSLMKYASLKERDYMLKANDIISVTINN